jgi:hypothetical protein
MALHQKALWMCTLLALTSPAAYGEAVLVKERGKVDLAPFRCTDHTHSGFFTRICYDAQSRRMLIGFEDGTYRQYCRVSAEIPDGLLSASSKARFYTERIATGSKPEPFTCGKN